MSTQALDIVDSIDQVDPGEWDGIASHAVDVRHALMACFERANPDRALRYFLLREKGKLKAAGVASVAAPGDPGAARPLLGRAASWPAPTRALFSPSLACGVVRGPKAPVLVEPGLDENLWVARVLDAMERYAEDRGFGLGFCTTTEQGRLAGMLRQRGYREGLGLPIAHARVTWDDETGYLQSLRAHSKNRASVVKSEMNRFRRSGITIRPWDGRDEHAIYQLLKAHYEQRNGTAFDMPPDFLSRVQAELGHDCMVFVATKGDALCGALVVLRQGERARLWKVGVDHELDGNSFTYFNLTYYHLFRLAPQLGIRQIECGNAALDAKWRRGCEVQFTQLFLRPRIQGAGILVDALCAIQRAWYTKKFANWISA